MDRTEALLLVAWLLWIVMAVSYSTEAAHEKRAREARMEQRLSRIEAKLK